MTRTLICTATLLLAPAALADGGPTARSLRSGTPCGWDALFRAGTTIVPCGATCGTVLWAEGRHPKLKARMQSVAWKGKTFPGNGTIVNRWPGFEAVEASVSVSPSWLDGEPCVVLEYAPDAAVFGGVRDELRLVAPGVWLGRNYDGTTGQGRGWFALEAR